MKRRVQLIFGDIAGVGPELAIKTVADLPDTANKVQIVLTGNGKVYDEICSRLGITLDLPRLTSYEEVAKTDAPVVLWDFRSVDPATIPRAQVSKEAGEEVMTSLMQSIDLAKDGKIDGLVFAPFNKESMHKAGSAHYSELELFKEQFDRSDIPGEFNVMDGLWIARVTSHIPVREIVSLLTVDRIAHTIELLGEAQEKAGLSPRLAIAALNPHAGEHGMFGDEESEVIAPAMERVKKRHPRWILEGPMPADTMFPRILKTGGMTGVVGMYHDQLQIATKLIGLERGVTFHPGMKIPIATAAHGTAFDLYGQGKASHQALKNALDVVCEMVSNR